MMCTTARTTALEVGTPSVAVTAVAISPNNSIIAAYSSHLVNFDTKQRLKVFKHQAVHALCVSNSSLLVCGGRSVCIVDLSRDTKMSVSSPERRLKDWIISATWISDSVIAVLFSYNSVEILDASLASSFSVQCDSCCIIYGGCLVVEENVLVCCSGTVFNKPLLWKPLEQSKVITSYEGHSGVIFDVKLTKSQLFSVSDDRTLIIWDRLSGTLQHKLYGHTARVLKVVLMPWCEGVVSVGEDNQCIVWSRDTGERVISLTPHSGNGIRSVCCQDNTIVTGGWDSTVVRYTLSCRDLVESTDQASRDLVEGPDQAVSDLAGDPPKWVTWIDGARLIVQRASGELRLYDSRLDQFEVVVLAVESGLRDYSTYCKVRSTLVIGGRTGGIVLIDCKSLTFSTMDSGNESKVFSLTTVSCKDEEKRLFISCQEAGYLTLWQLNDSLSAKPIDTITLPKCKNRWLTSACLEDSGKFLVLGDRRGGVHLFLLSESGSKSRDTKLPVFTIAGLHGENGISQLTFQANFFVTVGRDGNVRYLKVEDDRLVIVKKHKPLSSVYWIEKLEQRDGLTVMYYFHGQKFKITVLETGETVFSVECGGGHRSWDVLINGDSIHFAYINNPRVRTVKQPITFNPFKRYGSVNHGSETHSAVYYKDMIVTGGEDCTLIVHSSDHAVQIPGHISSVRSLCVADSAALLFSAGGRGSLKAWHIPEDRTDLELVSDYTVVSETHIPVGYNSSYRFDQRNSDNDQRVMSVDCCESRDAHFLCLVACGLSNGVVYLLGYTAANKFVKLVSHYQYNCITRVKLTETGSEPQTLLLLLSTTFGMVQGLNLRDTAIHSTFSYRLHSSGINGLDLRLGPCPQVLTLGDDGDVILSTLSVAPSCLEAINPVARRTTHFSAGIAVSFLNTDRVITVGSDQRLFVLDLDLVPVFCCYVDVPDPHDLVISSDTSRAEIAVLVCGRGHQEFLLR